MSPADQNPFEAMMRQWSEAMGQAAKDFSPEKLAEMWPVMSKDVMEQMMGKGASPDGLDAKTRLLITLVGLTTQGAQNELALRQTVRHAAEAGATSQEIYETLTLAGAFAGLPAMTRATEIARAQLETKESP
ncbi:carboxymuconolactone decarboxylase family protein [Pseudaestuariivita sp.]|uniref:carboxymuconolactone decarboxylase family protein n=1 Tax=Pseudaestuariivita sp. TaxID=2211669 RepID=UPI004059A92A